MKRSTRLAVATTSMVLVLLASLALPALVDASPWPGIGPKVLDALGIKEEYSRWQGERNARAAIRVGELRLLRMGPVSDELVALVRERYGVTLEQSPFCGLTTVTEGAYTDAYNEVMRAELRDRFGTDKFDDCREEVARAEALKPYGPSPCATPAAVH